jgi:hypothetical protein
LNYEPETAILQSPQNTSTSTDSENWRVRTVQHKDINLVEIKLGIRHLESDKLLNQNKKEGIQQK